MLNLSNLLQSHHSTVPAKFVPVVAENEFDDNIRKGLGPRLNSAPVRDIVKYKCLIIVTILLVANSYELIEWRGASFTDQGQVHG